MTKVFCRGNVNFHQRRLRDKTFLYFSSESDSGKEANIRRESKLYSYKDQMAEIEIRKELERKKKLLNPTAEPELTPKQKEQMKAQLQKEATIRARVHPVCFYAIELSDFAKRKSPS